MIDPSMDAWKHPLRWLEFDASSVGDHAGLLGSIRQREVDGLTLTGIFTEDQCSSAVRHLAARRDEHPHPAIFGTMLGLPLAELARSSAGAAGLPNYLDVAEQMREFHVEAFGQDPFDRIRQVLEPMADGLRIETPQEGSRRYASGNVRWMEPGGGGLPAHVGNEFLMHGDASTDFLRSTTVTKNHYSWFVVLQPPTDGGALSVFDLLDESDSAELESWGEQGRDDSALDLLACKKVSPPAGSLVIFGGGWRWHRVDRIGGDRPRCTYGGFAGRSVDGTSINFWF